jgi:hypothetical protein
MCRVYFAIITLAALTGSTAAAEPAVTLDTDPNLAGWWRFDETSGKTAADASAHNRDAALKGGLSFGENSVAGRVGRALRLDGEAGHVEVAKYKGVSGTRPRTVATWIKGERPRGRIVSWGTDEFGQMFNFGYVRGRIGVTPHGGYLYINEETHDNEWHHVAAVVQEAELPNLHDDVKLYLDGAPAEIHDIGLLDLWPLETGDELRVRIGQGYRGLLDDVRIYDRALTVEEINAIYRLETNRPLKQ